MGAGRRAAVVALAAAAALSACAPGGNPSLSSAVSGLGSAPPAPLTPAETAEAARLAALAPPRSNPFRAVWDWDWRSELSGMGRSRVTWFAEGAVYRQALGEVEGREVTGPERVAAAEAALAAAARSLPIAREAARLADADLAALRREQAAAAAAAEAARVSPPPAGQPRPEAMSAEAIRAARAAPEARAALVTAMAAAARADAEAVAAADAGLGVYGGPSLSRLRAISGEIGRIAGELETLARWFRDALAAAPGGGRSL